MIRKALFASAFVLGAALPARAQATAHEQMHAQVHAQMHSAAHDSACAEVHTLMHQHLDSASMATIHATIQESLAAGVPIDSVHHMLMRTLLHGDALHTAHAQLDSAQMEALHTCMAGMLDEQTAKRR